MPKADTIVRRGQTVDYYEISMKQFAQQILPAGLPETTVWGYGAVKSASPSGLLLHNAPSLTIEAQANRPVRVKWINDLTDANGNYLPHLLPVDQTLHWANPPGGVPDRDTRPTFTETPGPYTGPVPIVTHVHGAVGVADDSDGYAEAWYLPAAKNIPPGYARNGTWFRFFAHKAAGSYGVGWPPGSAVFQYPNENRASTIWYHDHALGMTRLNVYAGPAGFYLIRGGPAGDDAVIDSRSNAQAVLPRPAPTASDPFPPNKTYYEIPIAIQDRSFNEDGSLFYPDSREFFDGATADDPGFIPDTDLSPIWNPEFFGNMIMVNGNTWPFQTVEQRRYRLRFLNGCQSRFLILDFGNIPGAEVWQIGNEGGFLAAPVDLTAGNGNRLLMGLAERADLIVDFTNVPVGNYVLANVGPDEPFGGGEPDEDFDLADPDTTGQIMQFRVVPAVAPDPTTPPQFLVLPRDSAAPDASADAGSCARGDDVHVLGRSCGGHVGHGGLRRKHRGQDVGRSGQREPERRRHGALGALQHDRGRSPDAHPRDRLRGCEPPGPGDRRRGGGRAADRAHRRADRSRALGEGAQRHRHRLSRTGHTREGQVHLTRPVRLALPHRRARGQRDDAALPDRTAPTRPARLRRRELSACGWRSGGKQGHFAYHRIVDERVFSLCEARALSRPVPLLRETNRSP